MDFRELIISILGIQDVVIEDIKRFKKDLRLEIKVRQKRSEELADLTIRLLQPFAKIGRRLMGIGK